MGEKALRQGIALRIAVARAYLAHVVITPGNPNPAVGGTLPRGR